MIASRVIARHGSSVKRTYVRVVALDAGCRLGSSASVPRKVGKVGVCSWNGRWGRWVSAPVCSCLLLCSWVSAPVCSCSVPRTVGVCFCFCLLLLSASGECLLLSASVTSSLLWYYRIFSTTYMSRFFLGSRLRPGHPKPLLSHDLRPLRRNPSRRKIKDIMKNILSY